MRKFYITDRDDTAAPANTTTVLTETDFICQMANSSDLFIIGENLGRWARQVAYARGVETVSMITKIDRLKYCLPMATDSDIEHLYDKYFDSISKIETHQVTSLRILGDVFPDFKWQMSPSLQLAALWLRLLEQVAPEDPIEALLEQQARDWHQIAEDELGVVFTAFDKHSADLILASWLGYGEGNLYQILPTYPLEVSTDCKKKAERKWREVTTSEGTKSALNLLNSELPLKLKRIIGSILYDYRRGP